MACWGVATASCSKVATFAVGHDEAAANCADTHVRASCTRASAPCVLYVPEAQGSLPPAPHALCAYAVRVPASGVQQVVPQFPYNLSRAPTCYMHMCMHMYM